MTQNALLLFRHGNTFESDQTPVWVGARTDLPLTAQGEQQAVQAADYVATFHPQISFIKTGPLRRTRRMAAVISLKIDTPVGIDLRLREIDYGMWEGLSGDQIKERFGADCLEAWEEKGIWPENMEWKPTLSQSMEDVRAFLDEAKKSLEENHGDLIAVTSNGVLRLIYKMITGDSSGREAKVKTGHLCLLRPTSSGWTIEEWNKKPQSA